MCDPCPCWLQTSLLRVFASSPSQAGSALRRTAARGERLSFLACARNMTTDAVAVRARSGDGCELPVRIRRIGAVSMAHHNTATPIDDLDGVGHVPGLVPDVLFDEDQMLLGPLETGAFWVSVEVPRDARPGLRAVPLVLATGSGVETALDAQVLVSEVVIDDPDPFRVTHWFYADAICDWYRVRPFDEKFWAIAERYMANHVAHGGTSQYVPLFTPPTDGVKRPTQLMRVQERSPGQYDFDFRDVERWVAAARRCGARFFEWTHFFTQWGVENAIRVYRTNADPASLLWPPETGATSETYRAFLAQFLPVFHAFLTANDLLDRSLFHVSDEPNEQHVANYKAARGMLRDLAPWMRVSDALSHIEFARDGLVDIPIPVISSAAAFADEGIPSFAYFCCGPRGRYLNRLMDTPLAKIRMAGWLLHRFRAGGFLHWGYNYWYRSQTQELIDPFTEQAGGAWPGWAYGDPFVVYPGSDGPLDSIRWEVWAESMQDLALLRTLGVRPDDPMLAELAAYDAFPKSAGWVDAARARLLGLNSG